MPFVVAITAVDNAWCFVSAVSFSAASTKQDLLAEEPLQLGREDAHVPHYQLHFVIFSHFELFFLCEKPGTQRTKVREVWSECCSAHLNLSL